MEMAASKAIGVEAQPETLFMVGIVLSMLQRMCNTIITPRIFLCGYYHYHEL